MNKLRSFLACIAFGICSSALAAVPINKVGSGLTLTSPGVLNNNFATGVSGGQTIYGGLLANQPLKIRPNTTNTGTWNFWAEVNGTSLFGYAPGTDHSTNFVLGEDAGAAETTLFQISAYGSTFGSGGLAGFVNFTSTGVGGIQYTTSGAGAGHYFYVGSGPSLAMTIDASTNVITPKHAMASAASAATGYITSTAHATKGSYYLTLDKLFAVDELNNRLGIAGAGVTAPFAPSAILHVKGAAAPDPLALFETTGNYVEVQLKTAGGTITNFTKDNTNALGYGLNSLAVYNSGGPIQFVAAGTTDGTVKALAFTPSNIVFGNAVVSLTASGERFKIANGNTTQTVASAAGATWNYFNLVAPTVTASGATNITTAAGFNAYALGVPAITSTVTITNSAALYVAGAPTITGGGAITNAYAQWVDSGLSRFDGDGTNVFELPADATGNVTAATGRIPVKVGGSTVYLRYYAD